MMRIIASIFVIFACTMILATSLASEDNPPKYLAESYISDQRTYVFLDATFSGEYYYALYYVQQDRRVYDEIINDRVRKRGEPEPTVCCFLRYEDGSYHGWYYHKLDTNANRIIATGKYLVCLNEMDQEIEILEIRDRGSLRPLAIGPITNSQYQVIVEGEKIYIAER